MLDRARGVRESIAEWRLNAGPPRPAQFDARDARREVLVALRAGHGNCVDFVLRATSGPSAGITLDCADPRSARWVSRVLVPAYPPTTWTRQPPTSAAPSTDVLWGRRVRAWPAPLGDPIEGTSAIESLAAAVRPVPEGLVVRWRFSTFPPSWKSPERLSENSIGLHRSRGEVPEGRPSARASTSPPSSPALSPLFWKATVSLAARDGFSLGRAREEAVRVVEAGLRTTCGNGVRFRPARGLFPHLHPWFAVAEDELADLLPSPWARRGPVRAEEKSAVLVLPVGRSSTGQVYGPPVEADQGRHLAVLGETGMGKSSTIVSLAHKASCWGGVVLFDPLGETALSFLAGLSEEKRSRLVEVAPGKTGCAINALEGIGPETADPVLSDRRLNDLVHAFQRIRSGRYSGPAFWGPRLEEMLSRALVAAAAIPGGTLIDAHSLLATGGRTRQVVPAGAVDAVRALSERIRDRPEDAEGARRLLYEVVRSPVLRAMLCDPSPTFHARTLVEPGRIAVISGDAGTVGESVARYLLATFLALVWSELLARPSLAKTFVVMDETQWFSHESLAEMLRLARRKNVHVLLATQSIASLPEEVAKSVWTNVSDFVAFRGSPEEANELARATRRLAPEEILALPRGHAAVLLGKGSSVLWLRTAGRPPSRKSPEQSSEPSAATPPEASSARSEPLRRPAVEAVLSSLRELALRDSRGKSLRVSLTEMRRTVDPSGQAVRTAGAVLTRAGAIVSVERTKEGSFWVLDPTKIPSAQRPAPNGAAAEASDFPQPS